MFRSRCCSLGARKAVDFRGHPLRAGPRPYQALSPRLAKAGGRRFNLTQLSLTTASLLAELDTGSVLIWVGGVGNKQVDWKSLKKDGIYGIYYQTEPGCGPQDVDEVWDYTWANIDLCPKSATTRRYIPPGLVLLHGPTHEDSRADRQAAGLSRCGCRRN